MWFAFARQPRTFGSYEKNFILGLGPDFTRGCKWSLGLTFPSPSGARGLKSRYIQSKKRKAVLQQFPFQIICLKTLWPAGWRKPLRLATLSGTCYLPRNTAVCLTRVSQHQTDAVDDGTENKKKNGWPQPPTSHIVSVNRHQTKCCLIAEQSYRFYCICCFHRFFSFSCQKLSRW